MAWTLKPLIPSGYSFDGEIVYPSENLEVDTTFKQYVENVRHKIRPQFQNRYTGFETKKYRVADSSEHVFNIMLVGNLPRWLQQLLNRLAVAVNGAGMVLQFDDTWMTTDSSIIYHCRWVNAGDFVDNSILLQGGSIDLISYTTGTIEALPGIAEYQRNISNPGLEWQRNISTGTEYQRVI